MADSAVSYTWLAIAVAAATGIFLQAGAAVVAIVFRGGQRPPFAEAAALAFGLGVGSVTTEMLLFSLIGVPLTVTSLLVPWAGMWALLAWSGVRRPRMVQPSRIPAGGPGPCELVVACLLGVIVAALLFRAGFWPLWWWDTWAIWGLKAQAFFHYRDATPFVADAQYALSHPDYPILYPLAGTLIFLILGQSHDVVQVLSAMFYGSSLLLFRSLLIRFGAARCAAALGAVAVACAPNVLSHASEFLAEHGGLWFLLATVGYTYQYARTRERALLAVGGLAAGFLTQVRAEGVVLVAPVVLFLLVDALADRDAAHRRSRLRAFAGFAGIVTAVYLPWLLFSRVKVGVTGGVSQVGPADVLRGAGELGPILRTAGEWMTSTALLGPYVLLFPLLALLVALNVRSYLRSLSRLYLLVVLAASAAPPVILLMTLPYWRSAPGMSRYLFLFTALSLLLVGVHVSELWPRSAAPGRLPDPGTEGRYRRFSFVLHGAAALSIALVVTSAGFVAAHYSVATAAWTFESGTEGWRPGPETELYRAADALELHTEGQAIWLYSPDNLDIDGDLNAAIHVNVRLRRTREPGLVRLWWRPAGRDFSPVLRTAEAVRWTGQFQSVTFRPGWTGGISEFLIEIPRPAAQASASFSAFVSGVHSGGRLENLIGLVLTRHAVNPWPLLVVTLVLWAAFARARRVVDFQRIAVAGAGAVTLVLWVLADAASAFSFPLAARPVRVVSEVLSSWNRFSTLTPWERIVHLEQQAGRPGFPAAVRHVAENCPAGKDVLIWSAPNDQDAGYGGYVFQRSGYLLFPSKVFVVQDAGLLERLLGEPGRVGSVIAYGLPLPDTVIGDAAYRVDAQVLAICRPALAAADHSRLDPSGTARRTDDRRAGPYGN